MTANLKLRPCREPLPRLANHSPLCFSCCCTYTRCCKAGIAPEEWAQPTGSHCPHGCLPCLHFLITPLRVVCGPSRKARPLVTCKGQADSGVCSFVACLSWEALGIHPWASTCQKSPLPQATAIAKAVFPQTGLNFSFSENWKKAQLLNTWVIFLLH